jgi:predicted ATPase
MSSHCRINLNEIKLYGRKNELIQMKQAYERAESGGAEVVLVSGAAGTGKTELVEKAFIAEDCIFARGSFGGGASGDSPFAAIVGALSDLVEEIWDDEEVGAKITEVVQDEMNESERTALSRFVPSFNDFFGDEDDSGQDFSCQKDSLTRRKVALRHFLRIVTEESDCPVVVCLEDLQCADAASMDLIEFIANDCEQQYLLVIGTYRESELDATHPLNLWREQAEDPIRRNSINPLTYITVKGLTIVDVNGLLAAVLRLEEGVTFPLATLVMTRTNGNIFFIIQLLEYWQNEKVIFYDMSTFSWAWHVDRVRDTALSDHVVGLVASRIQRHPQDIQNVLQLSACLGYKVDPNILEVVKDVVDGKPLNIETHLEFCVQERLMERLSDGRVKFFHEQIHQAALKLLPVGDALGKLHFRMGVRLWSHIHAIAGTGQKFDDRLLFLCAEQLSSGSQHILDMEMKVKVAQLNCKVGIIATEMSAFATAAGYFEVGIELLNDAGNIWKSHHTLCMSLYVPFAEVQYYVGRFDSSLEAIEVVLAHEPSANAIMRMKMLRLRILKSQGALKQFVTASLQFLDELGEKLNHHPSFFQARSESQKVAKKLQSLSDEDVLKLPRTKSIIMEVLNAMLIPLETLEMHNLTGVVISRAVKFSIQQGITDQSPEAFALFGVHLIAEKQELAEGYRYGELALKLANKIDPKHIDARVVQWVYLCTKPWQLIPMAQCVDHVFGGHVSAMKRGDPFTAFMSIDAYFQLSYCSALELRPLISDIEEFSTQMLDYGQKMIFLQILPLWQCILNLSGASRDPLDIMHGEAMDRAKLLGNENAIGKQACHLYLMQIAFYMGDLELATDMSAKLQKSKVGIILRASCLYPSQIFFFGLIAISNARLSGKRKYKLEAAKHVLLMRQWVEKRAANLLHKLLIMEAEYETLETDVGDILRPKYDLAISTARKSGYLQDAAVAAYLAGKQLLSMGDYIHYADAYIRKSALFYKTWGAYAVAEKVRSEFPSLFGVKSALEFSINSDSDDDSKSTGSGNGSGHLSRERFDGRVSAYHQRRLSEC